MSVPDLGIATPPVHDRRWESLPCYLRGWGRAEVILHSIPALPMASSHES